MVEEPTHEAAQRADYLHALACLAIEQIQREARERMKPYIDLAQSADLCRRPSPLHLDGRWVQYTGPVANVWNVERNFPTTIAAAVAMLDPRVVERIREGIYG